MYKKNELQVLAGAVLPVLFLALIAWGAPLAPARAAGVSDATDECLACHESIHPGIVDDWKKSRHARTTPVQALASDAEYKKISVKEVPQGMESTAVGCAECHTSRPDKHKGTFDHNGFDVHTVVSPADCAQCHGEEASQYKGNIMSHAYANLMDNPVYDQMITAYAGLPQTKGGKLEFTPPDQSTREEACLYCHGTRVEAGATIVRDTMLGEMEFVQLSGWPNQGVGRINTDNSLGACSACHTRHKFSMEEARKPYTCAECHKGPDVPAYKVYTASKHGTIFSSDSKKWDFSPTAWTIGQDFSAPTCASCHMSLLTNTDGEEVAPRTHKMSDRLSWRLFGVIYAHSQPKSPETSKIRNADGQPLPTTLDGKPATAYLIDPAQREERQQTMKGICNNCHAQSWTDSHFRRLEHTIGTTNQATRTATDIMTDIWNRGLAQGPFQKANLFDEAIERKWARTWLFYANTARFAAAMAGGGDYGVFADGRFQLNEAISGMHSWLESRKGKP